MQVDVGDMESILKLLKALANKFNIPVTFSYKSNGLDSKFKEFVDSLNTPDVVY